MSHDADESRFNDALARRDWRRAADAASALAANPAAGFRDRWVATTRVCAAVAEGDHLAATAWQDACALPDPRVSHALLDELRRVGERDLAAGVAWLLSVFEDDVEAESSDDPDDVFLVRNASRFADHWLRWLERWPSDVLATSQALQHLGLAERHDEALRLAEVAATARPLDDAVAVAVVRAFMGADAVDRASALALSVSTPEALTAVAEGLSESDPSAATAWFERALARDPDDTATLYSFASHLHDVGDGARAEALEERASLLDGADDQ